MGLDISGEIRPVEAAIALRYPESIGAADHPSAALAAARMPHCILYENGARFPESGWLEGGITDLADLIGLVSVPQRAVDEAAAALERGIDRAANVLEEMGQQRPNITPAIARLLGMTDVPQTRRMAGAIIANALIFTSASPVCTTPYSRSVWSAARMLATRSTKRWPPGLTYCGSITGLFSPLGAIF